MGLKNQHKLLSQMGSKSFVILFLISFAFINVSASTVADKTIKSENSPNDTEDDANEILGIGQAAFIGICVAAGVVIIGVPIACCFCCACLCFSSRKKQKHANAPVIMAPQTNYGHHGQPGAVPPTNYPGGYPQQLQPQQQFQHQNSVPPTAYGQPPQQQQSHQQFQRQNSPPPAYGQSSQPQQQFGNSPNSQYPASPPSQRNGSMYQDSYGPRHDANKSQVVTHPGDSNLIVNRFSINRPAVPPKPAHKQYPGWTNVTKEVKMRNQLKKDQYDAHGYDFDNDAYDGGTLPNSPAPSNINNNGAEKDNFMY